MTAPQWCCVICLAIVGRQLPAHTLIAGDAVCTDHAALRIRTPTLREAVEIAREDIGVRPTPPRTH